MSTTWIVTGVVASLTMAASPAKAGEPPSIEKVMEHLGFDESQKASLLNGEVLKTGNPDKEKEKSELAVSGAMLVVRLPLATVVDAYMGGEIFRTQTGTSAFGEIDGSATDADTVKAAFARLGYTAGETQEARKVLGFKGGQDFNLADDEIARFRAISTRDPHLVDTISAAWRDVLVNRFLAYRKGGLDDIEPYRRSSRKTVSPGKELTVATASFSLLRDHFPAMYDEILVFPQPVPHLPTPAEHRFYWVKQAVQGRPDFLLVHHAEDIDDDRAIVVEQQYYVGHSYNSLEAVIGCVPYEGGTVVFYTSRVFTCQVTGFASGIARGIGRNQAMNSVAEELQNLRTVLEKGQRDDPS